MPSQCQPLNSHTTPDLQETHAGIWISLTFSKSRIKYFRFGGMTNTLVMTGETGRGYYNYSSVMLFTVCNCNAELRGYASLTSFLPVFWNSAHPLRCTALHCSTDTHSTGFSACRLGLTQAVCTVNCTWWVMPVLYTVLTEADLFDITI